MATVYPSFSGAKNTDGVCLECLIYLLVTFSAMLRDLPVYVLSSFVTILRFQSLRNMSQGDDHIHILK